MAKKIIFYVPVDDAEIVKKAMFEAGAGVIGNYDQCSFETLGRGQFRAKEGASPHIGKVNKLEVLTELRVEMICREEVLKKVLLALLAAHPYEEVALDVIDLYDISKLIKEEK